jgi:hypothetical protein
MSKTPTTPIEFLYHLYSYISQTHGARYETLKQCIEKLFSANVRILEVVETIRPYKDDVILALIEALNLPKNKTFSLHENTLRVLEQIGDHDAVLLILDKFDHYIERFEFSLTKTLTAIAAREGEKTERLIVERYVDFLIDTFSTDRDWHTRPKVISVLSALKKAKILSDPRLPSILEKYIEEVGTFKILDKMVYNLALFILAKIDEKKAFEIINENFKPLSESSKATLPYSRVVCNQIGIDENSALITVFVKNQENSPFEETPYLFEYEKPLLLFLKSGKQEYQDAALVGIAEDQNNAARAAQLYIKENLPKWHPPKNELQECLGILAKHINFENWGFQQSYIEPGKYPTIIYDSESCRVKFRFEGSGDQHDHRTYLSVYYGRLHAPSNDYFMLVDKEEHWCWHDDRLVLNFIDGLSPEESIKQKHNPRVIDQFRKSDLATNLHNLSPAEWSAGMVAYIWKEYGKKLFKVFDLRNPDLWERFKAFVNEMYAIEQPNSYGLPPYNKIH